MNLGFIITGRMKSTRLPKKLTLKILGTELIVWMIKRAQLVFSNEKIVIATSKNSQDDILETIADREDVNIFRGDEEDVVHRLYEAAKKNDFDYFINITADCPLFGFDYINKIKGLIKDFKPDLVTSLNLTHGIFIYCVKTEAFKKIIDMKSTNKTEVWGDFFYSNPDKYLVKDLEVTEDEIRPNYRLTVDYIEDFKVIEKIYNYFGENTYKTSSHEIVQFLDNHPEIVSINNNCIKKYEKRWESQIATRLKEE